MKSRACHICGDPIGPGSITGRCTPCNRGLGYWDEKTVRQRVEYSEKLVVRAKRIEYLTGGTRKAVRSRRSPPKHRALAHTQPSATAN